MATPSRSEGRARRRVLVTGGSGALGRHVVPVLASQGWDITVLVHRTAVSPAETHQFRAVAGNIGDIEALLPIVSEVDTVCHLAAFLPPDYADPAYAAACFETNALATLKLGLLCAKQGKRLVTCSSGQAYVNSPRAVTEDDPLYPAERATFYLASKLSSELFVENLRRRQGLDAATFRIGSCYGPGMAPNSVVASFMTRARAGQKLEVLDGGMPACDFVYVADVAALIAAALAGDATGLYNAGSGTAVTLLDLANAVCRTFPESAVGFEVVQPADSVPASFPALSMDRTSAVWGHSPTPLAEGLAAFRRALERTR